MQRWWQLLHWLEEPFPGAPRKRVEQSVLLWAYAHGHATLADVGDHLLGPRTQGQYRDESFGLIGSVTDRNGKAKTPALLSRAARIARVLRASGRSYSRFRVDPRRRTDACHATSPGHHESFRLRDIASHFENARSGRFQVGRLARKWREWSAA